MDAFRPAEEHPVVVSDAERHARRLSAENFRVAALLLHTRGYVILKQAIPQVLADELGASIGAIVRDCIASKNGDGWYQVARDSQAVFWERNCRWRIFPKLRPPLGDAWVVANPFAMALLRFLLGPDVYCKFVSSDTCMKGAVIQSPHRELGAGRTWQPRAYVVNVPVGVCGLDNGPLEVWYGGSHLWRNEVLASLSFDDDVQDGRNADAERLAEWFPSRRLTLEPGDVLIRDPGLLHRGTVNHTDEPRSMMTMAYFRQGESHDYGEISYSLDETLWRALEPDVQALFADAFAPAPRPHPPRRRWPWASR